MTAPWRLPGVLLFLEVALLVDAGVIPKKLRKKAKAALKRGLKGYDLIDELDVWYGREFASFNAPVEVLDLLGNQDGRATKEDWSLAGLPGDHFPYFDKDSDGELNRHEATSWFLQRKPARHMNLSEREDPPRGHMAKLGGHRDPLPTEDLVYNKPYPHPRDFWRKHMDGYKPAILKGAQHGWPAMDWTKEVLRERFGWVDAKLEPKMEGRNNHTAYRDLDSVAPSHRLNISEYLRLESERNMYVVSILPQVMAWEVAHPAMLLCGSRRLMVNKKSRPPYTLGKHEYPHESGHEWMTHLFEANLWIASGKTRSQLHYDKEWNVNCLLSGRKRWVFINPFDYDEELQWARGRKFRRDDPLNNAWTDWIYLDPDSVDLIAQTKLRNMDFYEIIQEAGDCIFIPYAMLHQVEKIDEGLQVAASWMFLPETVYDEEVCSKAPLDEDLPLAAMDTLYMYTGKGVIPQGYMDPLHFAIGIRDAIQHRGEAHLTLEAFTKALTEGDAILRTLPGRKGKIKKLHKLFSSFAEDPEKGLRLDELTKVPLRLWCKPAAEGDPEGPLPCDDGQEYEFCDDEEFQKMERKIQEVLARRKGSPETIEEAKLAAAGRPAPPRVWPGRHERPESAGRREEL